MLGKIIELYMTGDESNVEIANTAIQAQDLEYEFLLWTEQYEWAKPFLSEIPDLGSPADWVFAKTLDCDDNKINNLPALPPNLEKLYCSRNELTTLPILPLNLKILFCPENQLESLPILPLKLESLSCRENKITNLPALPPNLEKLYCLDCTKNKLKEPPIIPNGCFSAINIVN